jgi:hypothetical protein
MDRLEFNVNEELLKRVLEIKLEQQKPIKRGFKKWLMYIYKYKSITGTRGTDAIAGVLTTSLSDYNSASNGSYVSITEEEFNNLALNVSTNKAGVSDNAF